MSRRDLALEAELGIGTVMKLLRAETDPSLGTLLAIAFALRLGTLDELVTPGGIEILITAQRAVTRAS
jgi:transcriptional regulator with XRE-family HTH domain